MELLQDFGMFFAKVVTAVLAVLILMSAATGLIARSREGRPDQLNVKRLNDRYARMEKTVRRAVEGPRTRLQRLRDRLRRRRAPTHGFTGNGTAANRPGNPATGETEGGETRAHTDANATAAVSEPAPETSAGYEKTAEPAAASGDREPEVLEIEMESPAPRVFVLRFEGDIRASAVDSLREEVTAVLTLAEPGRDRAVVCLESPGGMVPSYGLAASQLGRLREAGLDLTVVVDRVAASGGYMMAAVGNRIVAAPFAILGSIGVVAQIPNLHRWLDRHDIDFELLTAGDYKRTLTVFGENTDAARRKFQEHLDETHELFKQFLQRYRPQLELERVATGEHWYGDQARALGLADEVGTSDDLLMNLAREAEVFEVTYTRARPLGRRIGMAAERLLERVLHGHTPESRA
ncbi:protease SohB [Thioalkalivibrio sp. ALJ24]|uniref:protease SohB n=1 Tax=Thioalkalivibrio sp. ALJ24 TaxID=545276 RepID=UPI00037F867B|nr:protease SohB [Thioalkalivibrio sp. ALJ24]